MHCATKVEVPAVVYGEKQEPLSIHLEEKRCQGPCLRSLHELLIIHRCRGKHQPTAQASIYPFRPPGHVDFSFRIYGTLHGPRGGCRSVINERLRKC